MSRAFLRVASRAGQLYLKQASGSWLGPAGIQSKHLPLPPHELDVGCGGAPEARAFEYAFTLRRLLSLAHDRKEEHVFDLSEEIRCLPTPL